jgi:phosphoadenosine phosphosulfate reductase
MNQGYLPITEFNLDAMVDRSIGLLQLHQPKGKPYHGCFSGGKDSIVIKELARLAAVDIEWHYNMTTIDPPELVRFIRREHPDVIWDKPKHGNFFNVMVKKGFPTRRTRWCCKEYKESRSPKGAVLVMGVRAAESPRRAKTWQPVTMHRRAKAWSVAPILDWRDDHVWSFIRSRGLPYCELYDEGFTRLGCIGCPMAGPGRVAQFTRWPRFERNWKRAFRLIWERRAGTKQRDGREWFGSARFETWEQMWNWWLNDDSLPPDRSEGACQLDMWSNSDGA